MITLERRPRVASGLAGVAALALAAGCALISNYDPTSYRNATDLKAASLELIDQSGEPIAAHAAEVAHLRLELRQALEYERGKAKNEFTVQMWQRIYDPKSGPETADASIMGSFLREWAQGPFRPVMVGEYGRKTEQAFDELIAHESDKVKQ